MNLTRRQAIKRTAGTAVTVTVGLSAGHALLSWRRGRYPVNAGPYGQEGIRLIRPPGAVNEKDFLAGCTRCYRCQGACEPGAIQFFSMAYGEHSHTPYVDPSVKACTLCMKCTQACPTGVLKPMAVQQKAEVEMATVVLHEDRCLSYKAKRIRDEQATLMELGRSPTDTSAPAEQRGPCGACFTVCPLRQRAIKLEPGGFLAPVVYPEACVGCGLCEEICRVMVRGEPAIRVVPKRGTV